MDINRDNYEEFFLDFAEGNLSAEQEETLNNFLRFNQDLAAELKDFDLLRLDPKEITMPAKDALKKRIPIATDTISSQNFEMYSIAYLEKDLTEYQQTLFEDFLNSDEKYQASFKLMKLTYLEAEELRFPHKARLRKRSKAAINFRLLLPFAAAASIALLLLIRTDFFSIEKDLAVVPETGGSAEIIEIEPVVKKPPVREKAASIQIIRNSTSQVPVSNIKNMPSIKNSQIEGAEKNPEEKRIIAGINLSSPPFPELKVIADQIVPVALPLPSINMSSLALADRVRYQVNRASGLMDEEDVFIWNLASQGIEGINKRIGTNMSIMASQDSEGSVSGFQFKSRFLNVTAPISQDRQ